jgi:hypothetical protein
MRTRKIVLLVLLAYCAPTVLAGYSDGFITAGEYEYSVTWRTYAPPLIVDGGGADRISIRDYGALAVKSTSTPLAPPWDGYPGGVYDIVTYDNSHLLFLGGLTELITTRGSATAELKGGKIHLIKSMQYTAKTNSDPHIDLYCQSGWSWINNDPLLGIQGKWMDGSSFEIEFINDSTYDPTWTNINVIVPEPATLLLLSLGAVLLRREK